MSRGRFEILDTKRALFCAPQDVNVALVEVYFMMHETDATTNGPTADRLFGVVRSESALGNWRRRAQQLPNEAHVFYLVFKHRRTRWYARLVAACAAAYVVSPVQLIPNFIPVIGCLDDLLVLFVAMKLLPKKYSGGCACRMSSARRYCREAQERRKGMGGLRFRSPCNPDGVAARGDRRRGVDGSTHLPLATGKVLR
jgi:uncharacterized membrane protein YkvA (DUF1232 family)